MLLMARPTPILRLLVAGLLACSLQSCNLLNTAARVPGKVTETVVPGRKPENAVDTSELQSELIRLADQWIESTDRGTRTFALRVGTDEARLRAVRWRLRGTRRALQIASRADPIPALLDMIVEERLNVLLFERYWIPEVWGDDAEGLLGMHRELEEAVWRVAEEVLPRDQAQAARAAIEEWSGGLTGVDANLIHRAPAVEELFRSRNDASSSGLMDLFSLDPFAGLEPTAREVAKARLLSERVLFFTTHVPGLLNAELELGALEARRMPETIQLLADVERISSATEQFGALAGNLEATLRSEREAALEQVFAGLDAQRSGLVTDLERAQPPVEELLDSSRATLEAAEVTSDRLTALVEAVGTFLDRFEGDDETQTETVAAAPAGEPGRPFDITEYGDAVTRLGDSATELRELVVELETSLPAVLEAVDTAVGRGERSIDHAFKRGLQLGLLLIFAGTVAVLLVRRRGGPADA